MGANHQLIKWLALIAATLVLAAVCETALARGTDAGRRRLAARPQTTQFSRQELLVSTKPMAQTYMKLLAAEPRTAQVPEGTALRIERMFIHILQHAKQLRPNAEDWDWELVLVANDALAPFALPDGQIFVSPKWVAKRRLTDAEIALLLAHEMAHVIAEHMLERVAAFAAPRPRYLRVADVLRTLEQEWYLARELEPLIQSQELEADRIGMSIVCSAGISRRRALTLFDKMARAERGTSYINSHAEPLERKADLADWSRAQGLPCLD